MQLLLKVLSDTLTVVPDTLYDKCSNLGLGTHVLFLSSRGLRYSLYYLERQPHQACLQCSSLYHDSLHHYLIIILNPTLLTNYTILLFPPYLHVINHRGQEMKGKVCLEAPLPLPLLHGCQAGVGVLQVGAPVLQGGVCACKPTDESNYLFLTQVFYSNNVFLYEFYIYTY